MSDKRFIELMPGAAAENIAAHYEIKLLSRPKGMVTHIVERDTYRRPERETIDSHEPIRESYDAP